MYLKIMIIVSAEEFNHQSSYNSSGRFYQDRTLIPGVIFSIERKKVAINYCQTLMNQYSSLKCLLVEDIVSIQVWYEQSSRQILNQMPTIITKTKITKTEIDLTTNPLSPSLLKGRYLPIDRSFVLRCQEILTEFIGPIAKIIIRKIISQDTKFNRQQFIAKLIQEVHNTKQFSNIERQLKQLLSD
jgi:hypothetical protein